MCAILGCAAQLCLLAAVLCGSPATVCPYPMFTVGGVLLWVLWSGEKPKNKSWCGLVVKLMFYQSSGFYSNIYTCHVTPPTISNSCWFEQRNNVWSGVQILKLLVVYSYSTVSAALLFFNVLIFLSWMCVPWHECNNRCEISRCVMGAFRRIAKGEY